MNNETYDFEDRKYINPTVSRDEQLGFIDRLRDIEAASTAQAIRDTHNLGTDVPSNLGGLSGSAGIWEQRYMAPKMRTMISGLRATAQAQALSTILANYQNQMKQRYNKAYREYALKNAKNSTSSSSYGTGTSVNEGVKILPNGASDPYGLVKRDQTEEDM